MGKIQLENMEFYAYHGCFKEEQIIGTRFVVDLEIETDTAKAEVSDHLTDTLNYQEIYQAVKREMDEKSHLLEHVARRIINAVVTGFPGIKHIRVKVSKLNPPVGGKMHQVSMVLEQ
jgi:7,8-dihydroneopterin aldolase/epimerase/oxygenase